MKYSSLHLLLVFLVVGDLILFDGVSDDGGLEIWRNPFFDTGGLPPTISFLSPENDTVYYTAHLDVNVSVTGVGGLVCYYKIDDNAWNNCGNCVNPICGAGRTFHQGNNALTVKVIDDRGVSSEERITFTVYRYSQAMPVWDLMLFVPFVFALVYLLFEDSQRRKDKVPVS